jgi:hypothetical protein
MKCIEIQVNSFSAFKKQTNKKLHGLSLRANYTDQATASIRKISGNFCGQRCRVVSQADPYGSNIDFLDRSRYFYFN